jgi:hypothetical protein
VGGAGVVHQDIDGAERRERGGRGGVDVGLARDVAGDRDGGGADLLGDVLRGARVDVEDRDLGALAREGFGDPLPNPDPAPVTSATLLARRISTLP